MWAELPPHSPCAVLCYVVRQVFADYKTRGPVILKPSDTAELIEKLEDSQMQLGSMATNRYNRRLSSVLAVGLIDALTTVCATALRCRQALVMCATHAPHGMCIWHINVG